MEYTSNYSFLSQLQVTYVSLNSSPITLKLSKKSEIQNLENKIYIYQNSSEALSGSRGRC